MRFQITKPLTAILLSSLLALAAAAWADTVSAPLDYRKNILPILKDSCFACHLPGADAPYASKDPSLMKKINKVVGDGLDNLTMGDQFPFKDEDSPAKQLKHLEKKLTKRQMPPSEQAQYGLGLPLSDKNRKLLLDWVAQEKYKYQ